ncbi:putative cbiG [Burkholderia pseudomallei MSHR4003]|nr:putative cbiG [Burkholderia pseudomallei MSHR4003]
MQPWTTRRIPAALNPGAARYRGGACARAANGPRVSAVSGLTKTPLHLPGRDASSGWPRRPSGARRSRRRTARAMPSLTVAGAAQVGGPRRGDAPCFPFDCARQKPRASTETRASVGRAGAVRQGGQKSSRRSRPAVAGAGHARRRRRHALCYRMRAFGARARIRASGPTGNRKRCARAACAAPATVSRLRRARRASRPHGHCPRGWEGGGTARGQPGYRPTHGASRARRTPGFPRGTEAGAQSTQPMPSDARPASRAPNAKTA